MVLLSTPTAYGIRAHMTVAPVTTRIRRVPTHVPVAPRDGLDRDSAVNCDELSTIHRNQLIERIGTLDPSTLAEVDDAMRFSLGLDQPRGGRRPCLNNSNAVRPARSG